MSHSDFTRNAPATVEQIRACEQQLGIRFPSTYEAFLVQSNGGSGFIGNNYVDFWDMASIVVQQHELQFPGHLLPIGSDGGGECIAFDKSREWRLVLVPFVGCAEADQAIPLATNIDELFNLLQGHELFGLR